MRRLAVLAFVLALASVAVLGPGSAARLATQQAATPLAVQEVSLAQARAAIDAAVGEAQARDLRMVVAVVDRGANLVALARMDGAWLASVDVAIKKARTSALLQTPTGALGPLVQPGGPFYGAEITNEGLVTFGGGVPLVGADGAVIGAIGVSGSTAEDDAAVAEVGAGALGGPAATPAP